MSKSQVVGVQIDVLKAAEEIKTMRKRGFKEWFKGKFAAASNKDKA